MERPYPESDAEMIKDESIDNGRLAQRSTATVSETSKVNSNDSSATASNLSLDQEVLGDEPLASGPDLAATSRLDAIKARSRDFAREAESRAKRNPWVAVAAASATALVVGILLGRIFKRDDD